MGEFKRANLVKALLQLPSVLLLDAPFSEPGPQLTFHLQRTLKKIAHREGLLIIMATLYVHEAMALSDEVLIMRDGELVQRGSPQDIYLHPRNGLVAELFGPSNLIGRTSRKN